MTVWRFCGSKTNEPPVHFMHEVQFMYEVQFMHEVQFIEK